MDMITIDLTDIPVDNDDELLNETVEIFGQHIDIQEIAQWCETIASELITNINQRVKRVYIGDVTASRPTSMADIAADLE
jgi:alanine racemase